MISEFYANRVVNRVMFDYVRVFTACICHHSETGREIAPRTDVPLEPSQTILTTNDEILTAHIENSESPSSGQQSSKSVERTPSMKILISNRTATSPSTHRRTAVVRVNSRGSGRTL